MSANTSATRGPWYVDLIGIGTILILCAVLWLMGVK